MARKEENGILGEGKEDRKMTGRTLANKEDALK